jgi:hypothetical protein
MNQNKTCIAIQICPFVIPEDPSSQYGIVKLSPSLVDGIPYPNCNIVQMCTIQGAQDANFQIISRDNQNTPSTTYQPPVIYDTEYNQSTVFNTNQNSNNINCKPTVNNNQNPNDMNYQSTENNKPIVYNNNQNPNDMNYQNSKHTLCNNQKSSDMNYQNSSDMNYQNPRNIP